MPGYCTEGRALSRVPFTRFISLILDTVPLLGSLHVHLRCLAVSGIIESFIKKLLPNGANQPQAAMPTSSGLIFLLLSRIGE